MHSNSRCVRSQNSTQSSGTHSSSIHQRTETQLSVIELRERISSKIQGAESDVVDTKPKPEHGNPEFLLVNNEQKKNG